MPPRAVKRPPTASPLKKRPRPPHDDVSHKPSPPLKEEKEKEFVVREVERSERLELDDNDPQSEAEGDGNAYVGMREHRWEMDGGEEEEEGEGINGDGYMEEVMEVEEVEEEVEVEVEEEVEEEEEEAVDYEEEHHDLVKERRKRKEFEVFVGGLDRDATEEDLRKVFSQVGEITEVRLMRNSITHKNKGFAFLRFATIEQARRAITELQHPVVNGKQCGVAPSQDSDTLFVGSICKTWTKEDLKEKLAHYGVDNYEDLTLVEDTKNEGMNRGFAFLDFSCRAYALEACKRLQRRDVVFGIDRTARVAFADTFIEPDDEIMSHVRTIFLDGLPPTWDEDRVREHLKKFGRIEKVELARNMPAAKRIDFGFVTFDTHDAAVACVDGINDAEIGDWDKKVKVRARLSRPRQRGKLARYARGGYPVAHGSGWTGKVSWSSSSSRVGPSRSMDRSGRSVPSRTAYDGGLKRSLAPRDRDVLPYGVGSGRRFSTSDRSYGRRSPVPDYVKTSSKRDYIRQDEYLSGPSVFARAPIERHSYRETYPSRGSGYLQSPPRSISRSAAPGPSPPYEDHGYEGYMERPSNYRGSHFRDYSSNSSSKRPRSPFEDVHSRYIEPSIRPSRARLDYGGSSASLPYDKPYGSDSMRLGRGSRLGYDEGSRSSAGHSHGQYDTGPLTMGYRGDEISRGDAERMYSSYGRDYESRDYAPSQSDLGTGSYPHDYPSRRLNDGYISGRGSGRYY